MFGLRLHRADYSSARGASQSHGCLRGNRGWYFIPSGDGICHVELAIPVFFLLRFFFERECFKFLETRLDA